MAAVYLLDANVLIEANRDYYPMERVPEFWDWLAFQAESNVAKMPEEILNEVRAGSDEVSTWLRRGNPGHSLLLDEAPDMPAVNKVVVEGYCSDPTDVELQKIGRDPILVAYALTDASKRTVVTNESSKPSAKRANKKVPDVCATMRVRSCNTYQLVRELNFSTAWRRA